MTQPPMKHHLGYWLFALLGCFMMWFSVNRFAETANANWLVLLILGVVFYVNGKLLAYHHGSNQEPFP